MTRKSSAIPRYSHYFSGAASSRATAGPASSSLARVNLVSIHRSGTPRALRHERVLLIQAGDLVSIGLIHIASYLRRHGIEAYVAGYRSHDYEKWGKEVSALLAALRPSLVGIGFKWYHEVIGALWLAEFVKQTDPSMITVMGGNSAAGYYRELLGFGHVDFVVRGDGELPMLEICRGVSSPSNTAFRASGNDTHLGPLTYVQRGGVDEQIYISDLEALSPSKRDLVHVPNFIVGGKGCAQACLYCSGGRDKQRELFGRKGPHLRAPEDVKRDVVALHPYVGSFFFDFSSEHAKHLSLVDWFRSVFDGVECQGHNLVFLPWELPDDSILEYLTSAFRHVSVGLDIGTLSERHRNYLASRGLFKRYLVKKNISNADFLHWADRHRGVKNLSMMLTAISGMPFIEPGDFALERSFAAEILERDNLVLGYEGHRLHFEPGSPVAENPDEFQMESPIRSFQELVAWFETGQDLNATSMRFKSPDLEKQVERHARQMHELVGGRRPAFVKRYHWPRNFWEYASRTLLRREELMALRLKREPHRQLSFSAEEWLGFRHTGEPRPSGRRIFYAKNLLNSGKIIDENFFCRRLPLFAGRPRDARDYGALGASILDRFADARIVANVVNELGAAESLSPGHICAFIENAMLFGLLYDCEA